MLKVLYLGLSVLGLVVPWYYNFLFMQEAGGFELMAFIKECFTTHPSIIHHRGPLDWSQRVLALDDCGVLSHQDATRLGLLRTLDLCRLRLCRPALLIHARAAS